MLVNLLKGDKERGKCFTILNALAKHGVNMEAWIGNEKALHIVASAGHKELAAWLVDNGALVDSRTRRTGATAMMLAAQFGHAETIAAQCQLENARCEFLINAAVIATDAVVAAVVATLIAAVLLISIDVDAGLLLLLLLLLCSWINVLCVLIFSFLDRRVCTTPLRLVRRAAVVF